MKPFAWPLSIAAMVCTFLVVVHLSDASDRKAETAIAVSCVQSGGEWKLQWGRRYECVRRAVEP